MKWHKAKKPPAPKKLSITTPKKHVTFIDRYEVVAEVYHQQNHINRGVLTATWGIGDELDKEGCIHEYVAKAKSTCGRCERCNKKPLKDCYVYLVMNYRGRRRLYLWSRMFCKDCVLKYAVKASRVDDDPTATGRVLKTERALFARAKDSLDKYACKEDQLCYVQHLTAESVH